MGEPDFNGRGDDPMKVGVVGAGFVGAACAKSMLLRGSCHHLVLCDRLKRKAAGLAEDLSHAAVLCPATRIEAGPLAILAGAEVVVVTAGFNERSRKAAERGDKLGRLRLLPDNAAIYERIMPQIAVAAPDAIILIVTDPPDALADVARRILPQAKIVSAGTFLDSLRFRRQIALRLNCHSASVEANVIGEHGTSQVYVWSGARLGGQSVLSLVAARGMDPAAFVADIELKVRDANIEIIGGIKASQHGIGVVTARLVEAMLRDEGLVAPVGTFQPQFGVTLSLPSVIGAGGVTEVLDPQLNDRESSALSESADAIREALASLIRN